MRETRRGCNIEIQKLLTHRPEGGLTKIHSALEQQLEMWLQEAGWSESVAFVIKDEWRYAYPQDGAHMQLTNNLPHRLLCGRRGIR